MKIAKKATFMGKENYYNEIFARNYDRFTRPGYYNYRKEAAEFKKIIKGKEILELGIGTGCLAELLIKKGYSVEGAEPSDPMIKELKKKNLPVKVYKQDASELNIDKKYDAIFSHGTAPQVVLRKDGVFFDTYIVDNKDFAKAMKKTYEHLKKGGYFLCGVQSGTSDKTSVGDFYRSESSVEGDILTKTHFFRERNKWVSQTVTARMWREKDYINLMKKIGFKVVGFNKSKTWFVFKKY